MPGAGGSRPETETMMTPEERQMLAGLFDRVNTAAANPRDRDAEAMINDAVRAAPFAPYVLAQTVLVQQHALEAASQRIAQLEEAAAAHSPGAVSYTHLTLPTIYSV